VAPQELRLAELLAALSVATDLGMGQPPEKAIRSCVLATGLARAMDLPDEQVRDVYLATLLRHLGCSATARDEAYWFGGDELASRPAAERADFASVREMVALTLSSGRGSGVRRPRHLARAVRAGPQGDLILTAVCEVAAALARRLRCSRAVCDALYQATERWDGKGVPQGLAGEQIALVARISDVANQAVIFDLEAGDDAALAMVARRAGSWFDPSVAATFGRCGWRLLRELGEGDPWEAVLEAEPAPVATIGPTGLDELAAAFGDMVDLKSPCTLGHSSGVARLAAGAAQQLGMGAWQVAELRRAGLLHDLGRVAVSSGIWEKPRAPSRTDREQIRLHAYHTERILVRSPALEPLGRIAGLHHERLDGSGYHRGAAAASLSTAARLLAAADVFQAMTEPRPHRPARPAERAAELVADQAGSGRLDAECVRAIIAVAGQPARRVTSPWPAGLTDREVEVLRLLAAGRSNRQIAEALVVSPRTAEHHVQHIYTKIGSSTRAAASLFAMEHGLLEH
jgi:HD-GYP domain-containing protein (c-di-GMP phosphodiesterase class II)/DNA-binding CsgD family transcriptional regulator